MKVSEFISYLQLYKNTYGDVTLYSEKDDGRSTWVSPMTLNIKLQRRTKKEEEHHYITVDEGY